MPTEDPEKRREYRRKYRERNREKINARGRERYRQNSEKERARSLSYRKRHPEKARERKRRWRRRNGVKERQWRTPEENRQIKAEWQRQNPEKRREQYLRWKQRDPEKARAVGAKANRRRRARKHSAPRDNYTLQQIWERENGKCCLCRKGVRIVEAHIEHWVPLSKGGRDTLENVRVAHPSCNQRKAVKMELPDGQQFLC